MAERGGIWATAFVPGDILRTNDFWPNATVDRWRHERTVMAERLRAARQTATPLNQLSIDAMLAIADDPFSGIHERYHLNPASSPADLAARAAREALDRAGVSASSIDYVLNADFIPEQIAANTACELQSRLGLPRRCMMLTVDASANSALSQLQLATSLIAAGHAKFVLAVQTSVASRHLDMDEDYSPVFGDAATAMVIGPVREGYGVLAIEHMTDASLGSGIIAGVPGKNWWDEGRAVLYTPDVAVRGRMFMSLPAIAVELTTAVLKRIDTRPSEVDFYAPHQGLVWLRAVTQRAIGLSNAESSDTYPTHGNLYLCNAIASLARAQERLHDASLVLSWTGGNGSTSTAAVVRWGGRTE